MCTGWTKWNLGGFSVHLKWQKKLFLILSIITNTSPANSTRFIFSSFVTYIQGVLTIRARRITSLFLEILKDMSGKSCTEWPLYIINEHLLLKTIQWWTSISFKQGGRETRNFTQISKMEQHEYFNGNELV